MCLKSTTFGGKLFSFLLALFFLPCFLNGANNELFVGTATNGPPAPLDGLFKIDLNTNTISTISMEGIFGMTSDNANQNIYFTSNHGTSLQVGANLWMFSVGGTPTQIGEITLGGVPFRVDGLAFFNGVLYGSVADGVNNGFYMIDLNTFEATQLISYPGRSVSGIDADPITGMIYGSDDVSGMVIEINPNTLAISNVVAYPAAEGDLDGVALDDKGNIYLIPDDDTPGDIFIYNLGSGSYATPIPAPFVGANTFSGGGAVFCPPAAPEVATAPIPTLSEWGLLIIGLLVINLGVFFVQRKELV